MRRSLKQRPWTTPTSEHERRTLYRAYVPSADEFVYDEADPRMRVVFPYGRYKGRRIGEVMEINPAYIGWLITQDLREGPFTATLHAVAEDCRHVIERATAPKARPVVDPDRYCARCGLQLPTGRPNTKVCRVCESSAAKRNGARK